MHLCSAFEKHSQRQENIEEADEEEEFFSGELSASSCLDTICQILTAPLPEETLNYIECSLIPIFNFTFSEEGSDFMYESLDCLNLLLYNTKDKIPDNLWIYYPILSYIICGLPDNVNLNNININNSIGKLIENAKNGWGIGSSNKMLGCFKNFIGKQFILLS